MEYKLHSIIAWARDKPAFNCATFNGIKENYAKYHKFTKKQEIAIDNVFYKWKIEDWARNNFVYIPAPAPKITKYFTQVRESESDEDDDEYHYFRPGCVCWRCMTGQQLGECWGHSD